MVLLWALGLLSFLPLLEAQNSTCANLTTPSIITNATLNLEEILNSLGALVVSRCLQTQKYTASSLYGDQLSGRWFFIGSAFRNPEFKKEVQKIQADFFYFVPNLTEDTMLVQEYQTTEDRCVYNTSQLRVQRENGTLSKLEGSVEHFALLLLSKNASTFMLAHSVEDEKNRGLSFYTLRPEPTPEQLREFEKAIACVGMHKSEITYVDWKKDQCQLLQKQHELERKKATQEP